jgi:hypothetical protein
MKRLRPDEHVIAIREERILWTWHGVEGSDVATPESAIEKRKEAESQTVS